MNIVQHLQWIPSSKGYTCGYCGSVSPDGGGLLLDIRLRDREALILICDHCLYGELKGVYDEEP